MVRGGVVTSSFFFFFFGYLSQSLLLFSWVIHWGIQQGPTITWGHLIMLAKTAGVADRCMGREHWMIPQSFVVFFLFLRVVYSFFSTMEGCPFGKDIGYNIKCCWNG
jgi:hypothetical protein